MRASSSTTHATAHAVTLTCHPFTRTDAIDSIGVRVARPEQNVLALVYRLSGDLDKVQLPSAPAERSRSPLWQHTCCEIFIRRAGLESYHEFNFAPSGAWAAYAFERYREGAPLRDDALDPGIRAQRDSDAIELESFIRLDRLSPLHVRSKLLVALAAVIEERGGVLSYWALAHPSGKPDFHHPQGFALELDRG